jgi:hypothetical protein
MSEAGGADAGAGVGGGDCCGAGLALRGMSMSGVPGMSWPTAGDAARTLETAAPTTAAKHENESAMARSNIPTQGIVNTSAGYLRPTAEKACGWPPSTVVVPFGAP